MLTGTGLERLAADLLTFYAADGLTYLYHVDDFTRLSEHVELTSNTASWADAADFQE